MPQREKDLPFRWCAILEAVSLDLVDRLQTIRVAD
jgi:hypothetical protein